MASVAQRFGKACGQMTGQPALLHQLAARLAGVRLCGNSAWIERAQSLESMQGRERFQLNMARDLKGLSFGGDMCTPTDPRDKETIARIRELGTKRRWQEAMDIYRKVENPSINVRVVTLRAVTRAFQYDLAWQLFSEIEDKQMPVYNLMLAMYARSKRLREVEQLVAEMKAKGIEPDVLSYTSLISAYGSAGDSKRTLDLLGEMEARGFELTEIEFGAALGACGRQGDIDAATAIFAKMKERKVPPHIGHMTSYLMSFSRSRDEERARAIFAEIRQLGLKPDVVAYTALAGVFSGPESFAKVRQLEKEMNDEGIVPHVFFYNNMLRAAIEAEQDDAFHQVLAEMDARGVARNSKIDQRLDEFERAKARRRARAELQAESAGSAAGDVSEAPLPSGWESAVDPNTGRSYYWQTADPNTSVTWERPV